MSLFRETFLNTNCELKQKYCTKTVRVLNKSYILQIKNGKWIATDCLQLISEQNIK